jgi:hypothetical protein
MLRPESVTVIGAPEKREPFPRITEVSPEIPVSQEPEVCLS